MRVLSLLAAVCALPCVLAQSWTVSSYEQPMLVGISMISNTVGFMAGAAPEGPCAFKTTDGGSSWDILETHPHGTPFFFVSTAAQNESSAVLGGVSMFWGSSEYLVGDSFTAASEPTIFQEQAAAANTLPVEGGYALVGMFTVTHVNASADVAISYDGGKTYDYMDIGAQEGAHGGAYPTSQTWFIAAGTWPMGNASQPNSTASSLREGGHISRDVTYARHGKSAHLKHTPHHHSKDDTNSTGYIGQIVKTTNAGNSWTVVYETDQFYFPTIVCPTEDICYAVGCGPNSSFVLKTTDSGNTWNEILEVDDSCLTAAAALSEEEVWIVGGANEGVVGLAYLTQDGGNTFSNATIQGQMMTSVSFTDSNHGWATTVNEMQVSGVLIYA